MKNKLQGCTWKELMNNSQNVADELRKGNCPKGTKLNDWMIVGNKAVYCPYTPLFTTLDVYNKTSRWKKLKWKSEYWMEMITMALSVM